MFFGSYRKGKYRTFNMQELLTLHKDLNSPLFVGRVRVAHLFYVVLLCVFTFLVPCYDVHYNFRIKQLSVRLYLQLFVGGCMSYLCYLCLLAYTGVQHMLCCVFVLFFIVLCTLCCHFLWLSIFDCPFVYLVPYISKSKHGESLYCTKVNIKY